MNIAEAVEIRNAATGTHPVYLRYEAEQTIIDRYLWLTDPTPLTREVIEKELGSCTDYENVWSVNQSYIRWCPVLKRATAHGLSVSTLGQLRQIVSILRGGGK